MTNKFKLRLISAVCALGLFILGAAAAFALDEGYAGPYPDSYTVESGTLSTAYDPNNPAGVGSYGTWSYFHWRSTASSWIQSNINQSVFGQRNKVAIVWHAVDKPDITHCANLVAQNWAASNLPGQRVQTRSHCSGYDEEVRVLADSSTAPSPWPSDYHAQVQYVVQSGVTSGQINISTYWLDYYDNPTANGGAQNNGRGYMNKICFAHPGQFTYPTNGACP